MFKKSQHFFQFYFLPGQNLIFIYRVKIQNLSRCFFLKIHVFFILTHVFYLTSISNSIFHGVIPVTIAPLALSVTVTSTKLKAGPDIANLFAPVCKYRPSGALVEAAAWVLQYVDENGKESGSALAKHPTYRLSEGCYLRRIEVD